MSLRLRLLNLFCRLAVKPRLRRMTNPVRERLVFERAARWVFRATPLSLILPIKLPGGLPALTIRNRPATRHAGPGSPVILYFHGGGYLVGSPQTHAKMLSRLSQLTGLEVLAPSYPLAPEQPFPAGFNAAYTAFNALLEMGYNPADIILGGDSAGGGMALALMAKLCAEGRSPRAVFAFSPLTDMRFSGESFHKNAVNDPLLPAENNALVAKMYLAGHSPGDPRASPLLADFSNPPPVFLQYSTREILCDDSRRMAAHLRRAGGTVVEDEWPDPPHVWVLFDGLIPEARAALKNVAGFIKTLA